MSNNSFFAECLTWFAIPIAAIGSLVFAVAEFKDKIVSYHLHSESGRFLSRLVVQLLLRRRDWIFKILNSFLTARNALKQIIAARSFRIRIKGGLNAVDCVLWVHVCFLCVFCFDGVLLFGIHRHIRYYILLQPKCQPLFVSKGWSLLSIVFGDAS